MRIASNIDAKGKLVRLIYGCVFAMVGIVLLVLWAIPAQTIFAWVLSIGFMVGGAFAIFEARAGWCVIRAMGMKTPL